MFLFNNILPSINDQKFKRSFRCYPVALLPGNLREDVERGGKIIMPPSALNLLSQLNISYPMLFKLTNSTHDRVSHCGVLEFVADEGNVYMPSWMMQNLLLEEGDVIVVENALLPVARFAKFQPQSPDFLDISNPKAVLENALRSFACLSTGDIFAIVYNGKTYEVSVLETQPGNAVCIIECDMNVEFATPVGYQEPMNVDDEEDGLDDIEPLGNREFVPFSGKANLLDETKWQKLARVSCNEPSSALKTPQKRGIPDYNYQVGTLHFLRNTKPLVNKDNPTTNDLKPFSGVGKSLI